MNYRMSICVRRHAREFMSFAILACFVASVVRVEAQVALPPKVHVKGVNILSVTFPMNVEVGQIKDFALQTSFDGETYVDLGVGHPRAESLFNSIRTRADETEILVVVVGSVQYSDGAFFPESPGAYAFRWKLWAKDGGGETEEVNQTVSFGAATRADLAFLTRLGDLQLFRILYGKDVIE